MNKDNDYYDIGQRPTLRERAKAKIQKSKDWCKENIYTVAAVAPLGIGLLAKLGTGLIKSHNIRMQQRQKDLHVWDPTIGHYWELRRKLDNKDWKIISRRHDLGESLGQILDDLDVLKY